jgi:hypothetical protein
LQGPEGSSRIFAGTWRIHRDPCRDLAGTWKIFARSYKIFEEMDEDPTRSSSRSTKILMQIFKDL